MPKKRSTHLGRVATIGLGQIGGSIALRLTKAKAAHVVGYDKDRAVLRRARRMKLAAEYTTDLSRALDGADLTILALPVAGIIAALADNEVPFNPRALLLDVGSTKRLIMAAAEHRNPPLRFVGGHPLAGNERSGLDGVEPDVFVDKPFVLIPGVRAGARDVSKARKLVRTLGARPVTMDADLHDRITALTIGLPHTIAYLVRNLYERERRRNPDVQLLSGDSIRSTMRVSHSDPTMVGDFIASNRDWIEHWWHQMLEPARSGGSRRRR